MAIIEQHGPSFDELIAACPIDLGMLADLERARRDYAAEEASAMTKTDQTRPTLPEHVWVEWRPFDGAGAERKAPHALMVRGKVWAWYGRKHLAERARDQMRAELPARAPRPEPVTTFEVIDVRALAAIF